MVAANMLSLDALRRYEVEGLLKSQRHPSLDLTIWNYTPQCQFDAAWDEVTMQCRGLVTNDAGRIVARPFRKFFNLDEHERVIGSLPDEPFEVYEKLDGSLIIAFRYQGQTVVASRGSFISEQAVRARKLLFGPYSDVEQRLINGVTYCLEIIYPENRIVIDYGAREELVLLGVFNTETGVEHHQWDIGFPRVRCIEHPGGFRDLPQVPNEEGYVIGFHSGLRVKVKNEEYVRLHRLLTQTTPKTIWEALRDGVPMAEFLDRVPDEFNAWVRQTVQSMEDAAANLTDEARAVVATLDRSQPRAQIAHSVTEQRRELQPLVWMLLDGKDCRPYVWKLVKPERDDYPFRTDEEIKIHF